MKMKLIVCKDQMILFSFHKLQRKIICFFILSFFPHKCIFTYISLYKKINWFILESICFVWGCISYFILRCAKQHNCLGASKEGNSDCNFISLQKLRKERKILITEVVQNSIFFKVVLITNICPTVKKSVYFSIHSMTCNWVGTFTLNDFTFQWNFWFLLWAVLKMFDFYLLK